MDPNATLELIRELTADYDTEGCLDTAQTGELVEAVKELDEWMTKGGFRPAVWRDTTARVRPLD